MNDYEKLQVEVLKTSAVDKVSFSRSATTQSAETTISLLLSVSEFVGVHDLRLYLRNPFPLLGYLNFTHIRRNYRIFKTLLWKVIHPAAGRRQGAAKLLGSVWKNPGVIRKS